MNKKQKISLIGFFIGLIMISYLSIDSNKYTRYVVMLGYTISLSSAFLYSLSRYNFPSIKTINKNESINAKTSSNLFNIDDLLPILIFPDVNIEKYNSFDNFIPGIQKSLSIIKSQSNPELHKLFFSVDDTTYENFSYAGLTSKNEPCPDVFEDRTEKPLKLFLEKPLDDYSPQYN